MVHVYVWMSLEEHKKVFVLLASIVFLFVTRKVGWITFLVKKKTKAFRGVARVGSHQKLGLVFISNPTGKPLSHSETKEDRKKRIKSGNKKLA